MACAVPCVVTAVGDAPWLVGESGVVVAPRDAGALAAGLRCLLEAGADERRRRGAAARQRIVQHFSLPAMLGHYDRLYAELLAGNGGG
jgi:glycosyltransferase involved in cell wall biosynthesis